MTNKQLSLIKMMMFMTIGWGVAGLIGTLMGGTVVAATVFPVGWVSGGLITALLLRWGRVLPEWGQVLFLIIGWAICWPIGLAIGSFAGGIAAAIVALSDGAPEVRRQVYMLGVLIGLVLAGTGGGGVMALALRWANPSVRWLQVFIIVMGWSLAWFIGGIISWFISANIVSLIGWAVSGAIGGGVLAWQLNEGNDH